MATNYWYNLESECFYHIYNRVVSDSKMFKSEKDYDLFIRKFSKYCTPYFHTYAYCLVPNHFHFVLQVKEEDLIKEQVAKDSGKLSEQYLNNEITLNDFLVDQLRRLFSSYVLSFNKRHNRKGPLLQNKVKRIAIDNDDRLRYYIGYAHHNVIHSQLGSTYTDWKYSSFNNIISDKPTQMNRSVILDLFKGKEGFLDYHSKFKIKKIEEDE